jgi:hypothetical protein
VGRHAALGRFFALRSGGRSARLSRCTCVHLRIEPDETCHLTRLRKIPPGGRKRRLSCKLQSRCGVTCLRVPTAIPFDRCKRCPAGVLTSAGAKKDRLKAGLQPSGLQAGNGRTEGFVPVTHPGDETWGGECGKSENCQPKIEPGLSRSRLGHAAPATNLLGPKVRCNSPARGGRPRCCTKPWASPARSGGQSARAANGCVAARVLQSPCGPLLRG